MDFIVSSDFSLFTSHFSLLLEAALGLLAGLALMRME